MRALSQVRTRAPPPQLLSAMEKAAVSQGAVPRLPPGYATDDVVPVRTKWTEKQKLAPTTWEQGTELKYSAGEMMARGATAELIQSQVWARTACISYPAHCRGPVSS